MCWSLPCMAAAAISVWMYVWITTSRFGQNHLLKYPKMCKHVPNFKPTIEWLLEHFTQSTNVNLMVLREVRGSPNFISNPSNSPTEWRTKTLTLPSLWLQPATSMAKYPALFHFVTHCLYVSLCPATLGLSQSNGWRQVWSSNSTGSFKRQVLS